MKLSATLKILRAVVAPTCNDLDAEVAAMFHEAIEQALDFEQGKKCDSEVMREATMLYYHSYPETVTRNANVAKFIRGLSGWSLYECQEQMKKWGAWDDNANKGEKS